MDLICHRCGAALSNEDTFCPVCGAPQIRFENNPDTEMYAAALNQGYGAPAPNGVQWKHALRAAVTVAVPIGLMSSNLLPYVSAFCCLWIIGGAIAAIALYRKKTEVSVIAAKTGARIGFVVGILAAFASTLFSALSMSLERFLLHHGDVIDKTFDGQLEQLAKMSQSNPDPQGQMQAFLKFLATPDGRAAWILLGAIVLATGIVIFSMLGGALGARILTRRSSYTA